MATQVAVTSSADQAQPSRDPQTPEKSFLEAWLEYLKLLGVAATIGAAFLGGPIVTLLVLVYVAYLLSGLFGA